MILCIENFPHISNTSQGLLLEILAGTAASPKSMTARTDDLTTASFASCALTQLTLTTLPLITSWSPDLLHDLLSPSPKGSYWLHSHLHYGASFQSLSWKGLKPPPLWGSCVLHAQNAPPRTTIHFLVFRAATCFWKQLCCYGACVNESGWPLSSGIW